MEPIEQAVFTSATSEHGEGYHLVAGTRGVGQADARALSAWGPSEDALWDSRPDAQSLNFHPLPSGRYCISLTRADGTEYSGRGGRCLTTQCLVVPAETLGRFANNPFAVYRAARSSGYLAAEQDPRGALRPFHLVGHGAPVDRTLLLRLAQCPGPAWMAALVRAALELDQFVIASGVPSDRLIAGLIHCVPLESRLKLSFSTGLRFSVRRPFRLVTLPSDPEQRAHWQRTIPLPCFDLSGQPPAGFAPAMGWSRLVYDALESRSLEDLARHLAGPTAPEALAALPFPSSCPVQPDGAASP